MIVTPQKIIFSGMISRNIFTSKNSSFLLEDTSSYTFTNDFASYTLQPHLTWLLMQSAYSVTEAQKIQARAHRTQSLSSVYTKTHVWRERECVYVCVWDREREIRGGVGVKRVWAWWVLLHTGPTEVWVRPHTYTHTHLHLCTYAERGDKLSWINSPATFASLYLSLSLWLFSVFLSLIVHCGPFRPFFAPSKNGFVS
jgi:hypothetical protein